MRNTDVFKKASMAKPKMAFSNKPTSSGVNKTLHNQFKTNKIRIITATGSNFFDSGITPIFHLMKDTNRTKYTK